MNLLTHRGRTRAGREMIARVLRYAARRSLMSRVTRPERDLLVYLREAEHETLVEHLLVRCGNFIARDLRLICRGMLRQVSRVVDVDDDPESEAPSYVVTRLALTDRGRAVADQLVWNRERKRVVLIPQLAVPSKFRARAWRWRYSYPRPTATKKELP